MQHKDGWKSNGSNGVSKINSEVIGRASSKQVEESPGNIRTTRRSMRTNSVSNQNSWKATYAHKLAKKSDNSTAQLGDTKKSDERSHKIQNGTKKGEKRSYSEGNVSATISPSGRVRTTVVENSDDDIDDNFGEDEDEDT